jgi:hypothetical protein
LKGGQMKSFIFRRVSRVFVAIFFMQYFLVFSAESISTFEKLEVLNWMDGMLGVMMRSEDFYIGGCKDINPDVVARLKVQHNFVTAAIPRTRALIEKYQVRLSKEVGVGKRNSYIDDLKKSERNMDCIRAAVDLANVPVDKEMEPFIIDLENE